MTATLRRGPGTHRAVLWKIGEQHCGMDSTDDVAVITKDFPGESMVSPVNWAVPVTRHEVARRGRAGLQLRGGGGSPLASHPPEKGGIDRPPKILPRLTRTQNLARNENGIFGISA